MYASDENYPWGQCLHGWAGLGLEGRLTCQELRLEWWGYGPPSWQRMAFQTEQLGTVPLPGTDIGPMWQKSSKGQAYARSSDLVHHLHPLQLSHLCALLKWAWEPPGSGLSWDLKISVHCLLAKKTASPTPPSPPPKMACSPFPSLQRAQLTAAGLKSREVLTPSVIARGSAPVPWLLQRIGSSLALSPLQWPLLLPPGLYLSITGTQKVLDLVLGLPEWLLCQHQGDDGEAPLHSLMVFFPRTWFGPLAGTPETRWAPCRWHQP